MSDEPVSRRQGTSNSKAPPARHSNKTIVKWLAGAAAAAVLVGGGYYAWKNSGPSHGQSEVAENTASFSAPSAGGETAPQNHATAEKGAAAATTNVLTTPESRARPIKARPARAEVPEQTIGVSRTHASASQSDELVVKGARRPVWRYVPSAERLSEYYPAAALDRGREGEASLHCMVGKRGILDCVRVSETPARAGFGVAALQVARTFRHAQLRADGSEAVGTPINLRVLFRMAESDRRG